VVGVEHGVVGVEQVPETGGQPAGEDRAVQADGVQPGPGESGRVESGRVESGRPPVTADVPEDSRTAGLRR
jgi:hypothetical protein